jgi:dinuclear metal center YbgI/SA1388 family protein
VSGVTDRGMSGVTVGQVARLMEEISPAEFGAPGDSGGLLLGHPIEPVREALIALDLTAAVVREAASGGGGLVITHHPPLGWPLADLRGDRPGSPILQEAIMARLAVYTCHQALVAAPGGINDYLAERLGLSGTTVLGPAVRERLFKLVVFVPCGHEDAVREALGGAGAGHIGNYSHCAFGTEGEGTFLALEGANPFLGTVGRLERAREVRLETIVPARRLAGTLAAMKDAHPYEEVAFDVYPLANDGPAGGRGRFGFPGDAVDGDGWLARCRTVWPKAVVTAGGRYIEMGLPVTLAAVVAGDGRGLVGTAISRGIDAMVTGEMDHHDRLLAEEEGLLLVEVGHGASEEVFLPALAGRLRELARRRGLDLMTRVAGTGAEAKTARAAKGAGI